MNELTESTNDALAAVERGEAYLNLGLYTEATREFRCALELNPKHGQHAVKLLQVSLLGEHRFEEALAVGATWVERFEDAGGIIHMMGLLFNSLGRYEEADAFLRQHRAHWREAYDMACSAAQRGLFREALVWLNFEFAASAQYDNYVLGDSDLRPLWPALLPVAATRVGAHLLINSAIESIRVDGGNGPVLVDLDWNAIRVLPKELQDLFRYDHRGANFRLDAREGESRPADVQRALELRRASWQASATALRAARERAFETILAAQPLYAAAHAADGNFTAARWHLQWTLFHRPTILPEFVRLARPGPFAEMLANLTRLEARFPQSVQHLMQVRHWHSMGRVAEAEALHDRMPASLGDEPDYLFNAALIAAEREETDEALRLYRMVAAKWPMEVSPWVNAAAIHLERLAVDEAIECLCQAPQSAPDFAVVHRLLARCQGSDVVPSAGGSYEAFRGRPDLHGSLICVGPRARRLLRDFVRLLENTL